MKVISLVPSWTETLLASHVNVVGRTKFCLYPSSLVSKIPILGGTKNWDLAKLKTLKADLVLFDKEENTLKMAESCPLPYVCTHVTSVESMPENLELLSKSFHSQSLQDMAHEWRKLEPYPIGALENLPGVMKWGTRPACKIKKIIYLIWKKPWMSVNHKTFIGSVLYHLGLGELLVPFEQKYPEVDLESLEDKESTLLLFSSEPYPFEREFEKLAQLGFPYALVDGEKFSWFGVRTLRFLRR